ncbi:outer membrane protein [Methylobacterium marchantiae]|uniref:Outer membrane protein n=1 Tax=Methylobacterium marchantiae TaxID=600331 RepID=A0ABW3WXQ9_9HYPH|nr:Outer membrane protein A [Methylobacterium marchantiae]
MRTATLALLTSVTLVWFSTAQAADLDYGVLRGPDYEPASAEIDWNGFYFGAHAGYSSASLGFKNAYKDMLLDEIHDTTGETIFNASTLLRQGSRRIDSTTFGGFAGYNYQFDEIVIGIEVDYTSFNGSGTVSGVTGRSKILESGLFEAVEVGAKSSTKINDYGTIRARAGYVIGNFLPFITGGLAIGRAKVEDKVNYKDYGFDQAAYLANQTSGKNSDIYNFGYQFFNQNNPNSSIPGDTPLTRTKTKVVGGVTLGGGLEFALTQNILLRGEYQYVLFNDFDGHTVNINTVRGGAAVKF